MGYFNYFIKCIIRRFVKLFFTKKTFIFILVFLSVFAFLKLEGYCEFSYSDSLNLTDINNKLTTISTSLISISTSSNTSANNTTLIRTELDLLYTKLQDIDLALTSIEQDTTVIQSELVMLRTTVSNLYTLISLNNQKLDLIEDELENINSNITVSSYAVQSKIDELISSIKGNDEYIVLDTTSIVRVNLTERFPSYPSGSMVSGNSAYFYFSIPNLVPGEKYTFYFTVNNTSSVSSFPFSFAICSSPPGNNVPYYHARSSTLGTSSPTKTFNFTFTANNTTMYFLYNYSGYMNVSAYLVRGFTGLEGVNDSVNNLNQSVENTHQTITDSSVTVDTDLPQDNTQDITESGFNSIFTTIKNTFTSSSFQDLVLFIPFTGKSFTINFANVYGGFNSGIVGTLITLFWWYLVSVFIVKDISNKISKIKSGNMESIENTNIKEDIL